MNVSERQLGRPVGFFAGEGQSQGPSLLVHVAAAQTGSFPVGSLAQAIGGILIQPTSPLSLSGSQLALLSQVTSPAFSGLAASCSMPTEAFVRF